MEFNESNFDVLERLQLFVTTKVTTPLEWLQRQGELIPPTTQPPEVPTALAIWTPKVREECDLSFDEEEMCASDAGLVSIESYTKFLVGLRSIVESNIPTEERIRSLSSYLDKFPKWRDALAHKYRRKPKKNPWPIFLINDWENQNG